MTALDFISTIPAISVDALRRRVEGPVFGPQDDGWDAARAAWNLAVDQQPTAVVIPHSADDVVAAVRVARAHGLRVTAQVSGHNASAYESLQDTILLRMTELRDVEIDAAGRRARAGAGCEWRDVVMPAGEHGLAALAGSSPQVSVVGYALGGGIGWLARKHGLAADSVLALDVVTADGELRRVDADSDPDLYWALRGGGGSFGIVTAVELRLFDTGPLVAGAMMWPLERAREIVAAWRDMTLDCPDELTTSLRMLSVPDDPNLPEPLRGGAFVVVDGAFTGDQAAADAVLAPLRALEPILDGWMPCGPEALSFVHMDPEEPMPIQGATFVLDELPDEALDEWLKLLGPGSASPFMMAELRQLGGELARPGAHKGARSPVLGRYLAFLGGVPVSPELSEAMRARAERVQGAMRRWTARASYLNFVENPGDPAGLFEPDAYERLRRVKARVDPDRLFRANHDIPPAE
jgi:FAD/FMN-containing dehydrogenase